MVEVLIVIVCVIGAAALGAGLFCWIVFERDWR